MGRYFVSILIWPIALAAIASGIILYRTTSQAKGEKYMSRIDHLVFACPDLADGIQTVEKLLGVKAVPGGQHPGGGTRNALIGLGDRRYLEIIGPDPDQPKPPSPRRFTIDGLKSPRLVTWAAKSDDLEALAQAAKRVGVDVGLIQAGSRKRPDGVMLAWRLTVSPDMTAGGVIPFFIDWGQTEHPAVSLPKGCTLVSLRAEHPDFERVRSQLTELGLDIEIKQGPVRALIATVLTPNGLVELR